MCGITICSRHIYNRISYTRTRAERRVAKENACACVHIRKRTYVAAARRRGFCGQPPGREESVSAFERVSERRRIPFLPTRGRAQGSPRATPAHFILIPSCLALHCLLLTVYFRYPLSLYAVRNVSAAKKSRAQDLLSVTQF